MSNKADTLDFVVTFLAKREGIDKVLKILRYSLRLILASGALESQKDLSVRLGRLESQIGTSRKAYRLGKFLGNVNTLRKTPLGTPYGFLEWVANGGECIYYFTEQFQWLVKAGVLPDALGRRLVRVSACGELVGYAAGIVLNALRVLAILEREMLLLGELQRLLKMPEVDESSTKPLVAEIQSLRQRRRLRSMALAQDFADSLLALSDLRQRKDFLSNAVLLACAGLLSGWCSAYKNWPGNAT